LQCHGQPLKQERGFSAVRSDIGDASPDLLHQFYLLLLLLANHGRDFLPLEKCIIKNVSNFLHNFMSMPARVTDRYLAAGGGVHILSAFV